MTVKTHKGTIENWIEWHLQRGEGLGYVIIGDSVDHPQFRGDSIRTSWVVAKDGNEIETRNSHYTLGRPAIVQ